MTNMQPFNAQAMFANAQKVLGTYPTLCLNGLALHDQENKSVTQQVAELVNQRNRLIGHDSLRTVYVIIEWINANLYPDDDSVHSSYWLKGRAEEQIGYITNGQFILAAALLAYGFEIDGYDALIYCSHQSLRQAN